MFPYTCKIQTLVCTIYLATRCDPMCREKHMIKPVNYGWWYLKVQFNWKFWKRLHLWQAVVEGPAELVLDGGKKSFRCGRFLPNDRNFVHNKQPSFYLTYCKNCWLCEFIFRGHFSQGPHGLCMYDKLYFYLTYCIGRGFVSHWDEIGKFASAYCLCRYPMYLS
jgi:hypothetical protein